MKRLLTLVPLALLSCGPDAGSPVGLERQEVVAGPQFSISDGSNVGGNPGFRWLPPIARSAKSGKSSARGKGEKSGESEKAGKSGQSRKRDEAPTPGDGAFDPSLLALITVEICEWAQDACVGDPLRSLTSAGEKGERLRISGRGDRQHYRVDWRTKEDELDPARDYRIRVLAGDFEVGHADVDVVRGGRSRKRVDRSSFVVLRRGQSLSIRFVITDALEGGAVTGSDGGVVAQDNVMLDVPPGAVAGDVFITVAPVPESELPDDPSVVPGTAFEFGPSGTTFFEPVTLCVQYDDDLLPEGTDESTLRIHVLVDGSFTPLAGGTVDTGNNVVCAEVEHFSVFAIVPRVTPGGDVDPPVITNVTITPSVVDISTASADVTVSIDATDDPSGVEQIELQFWAPTAGPGGQRRPCTVVRDHGLVSGTLKSGTWECTITIPLHAETGMWKVGLAFVLDAAANNRFFTRDAAGDLCAEDGSGCITAWDPVIDVQGPPGDITAPTVGSVSFQAPSVDVTLGDADVTTTVTMTDDVSGIEFLTMQIASPSGLQSRDCFFFNDGAFDPALDLTIDCTFTLQQSSEAGPWNVRAVLAHDKVGNQKVYAPNFLGQLCTQDETECFDLGAPITVTSTPDLLPPIITGFALATDPVDASRVIATVTASDDVSGVEAIEIQFTSPLAGQVQHCFGVATATPGVWECVIQFPANAEAGTWPLTLFALRDFVGNRRFYFRDVSGNLCSDEVPAQACTNYGDTEIIVQ